MDGLWVSLEDEPAADVELVGGKAAAPTMAMASIRHRGQTSTAAIAARGNTTVLSPSRLAVSNRSVHVSVRWSDTHRAIGSSTVNSTSPPSNAARTASTTTVVATSPSSTGRLPITERGVSGGSSWNNETAGRSRGAEFGDGMECAVPAL